MTWSAMSGSGSRIAIHRNYYDAPTDGSAWMTRGPYGVDCDRHIVRGGSFTASGGDIHSAHRSRQETYNRGDEIGFRVARVLIAP